MDMKKWYKFLFLPILIFALVGCSDDDDESSKVEDGKVTQLQKHTVGKGFPIVIMCGNSTDRDIVSGKYREAVNWALEGLFSVHPMKSLRDYFDVYEVAAVAYYEDIQNTGTTSYVRNDSIDEVYRYVYKAFGEDIDDVILIVLNKKNFRSYSYMSHWHDETGSDIPTGFSTAYVWLPLENDGSVIKDYDPRTLLHEAIGHCFAGLADEYIDKEYEWDDFDSGKKWVQEWQEYGYYRNISFDSDVTKTYWADFAADSRYDFEKLGCYEGGNYREKGVYRPTERGIMSTSDCVFHVFGRSMIYKRCMKIAYGDSWKFNYEDFVKFDLEKAKAEHEELRKQYPDYSKSMRSCAPPRFVKMKASR